MLKIQPRHLMIFAAMVIGFAASPSIATAKISSFHDSFEAGNQQGWTSIGEVVLQGRVDGNPMAAARTGNSFLVLRQQAQGPGLSLTNTIVMQTSKGNACSLRVWVRPIANSGALALAVKSGFAAGPALASRSIDLKPVRGATKNNSYVPFRLSFRHRGTPLFVTFDGFGPAFFAIDDVNIACRSR